MQLGQAAPVRWCCPRGGRGSGAAGGSSTGRRRWPCRCARPRVRTSTVSVPPTSPRSDVVTHSRSVSRQPESRHTTSSGSPSRSPSASRWAGRSGLPLSSLASISTMQRACGCPSRLGGLDREQGGERGVAVVGAAPAVEPIALDHRRPRPETVAPAGELGLLVEVAVEQHGAVGERRVGGRDLAHDHRAAAGDPLHVDRADRRSAGPRTRSWISSTARPCGRGRPSRGRRPSRRSGS